MQSLTGNVKFWAGIWPNLNFMLEQRIKLLLTFTEFPRMMSLNITNIYKLKSLLENEKANINIFKKTII